MQQKGRMIDSQSQVLDKEDCYYYQQLLFRVPHCSDASIATVTA